MSSINNRNSPLLPFSPLSSATTADEAAQKAAPQTRPLTKAELEKQAEHVETPVRKASSAEMERVASQAGYVRGGKKRQRGLELDDQTQAPIPLPVDDVDESAWEQRTLDDAQEELALQAHELRGLAEEVAGAEGAAGLFTRLLSRNFRPLEPDLERLQHLADGEPAAALGMQNVQGSLQAMFGIALTDVAQGPGLIAASLVVAGMADAVHQEAGTLDPKPLCQGMQKLVEKSGAAVEDGRKMSSDINKIRALQSTFVVKR